MNSSRRTQRSLPLALALLLLCGLSLAASAADERVIILGFDGVDPETTQQYMDEGLLPNLSKLAETGSFSELGTSNPAESPVSWASFTTGQGPGHHGIFDFVVRKPGSYIPDIALAKRSSKPVLESKGQRAAIWAGLSLCGLLLAFSLLRLFRAGARTSLVGAIFLSLPIAAFAALALFRWLPYELPMAEATRKGTPFWDHVAEAGYRVTAIDLPVTFPAQAADGVQMTSGLGTPDVRQTWGNWTIYSDENFTKKSTETAGNLRHVEMSGDTGHGMMRGPVNFLAEGRPELDLPMQFTRMDGGLIVEVQGNRFELQEGEWSDWASVSFRFNPLIKMVAMTRFKLLSASEPFRVYQEPLNFDPHHLPPTVSISSPRGYAAELADQYGLRETVGWSIATNPLKDDQIDYDTFLEDLSYTMKQREAVVKGELAKDDWDLFVGVFLSTDRMQHMMYRFVDEGHPNYDAEMAAKYADRIPWVYQQMDRIVGDIMAENVDENTHLMIISDHGFHSFRRGVNINTWLVKNGFMSLKGLDPSANYQNLEDFFDPNGRFFKNVDWSKTQAYCLGLGSMYMNLRGRESRGIINPSEYDKVREEIIEALLAMEDPNYPDEAVIRAVFKREDIFAGPMLPNAPDLFVGFETKWRVSWQTGAGGIPPDIFEDNMNNWSGDHCSVDPLITGGIFFSNRKLPDRPRHIMDLAPTALKTFGIPLPDDLEGSPLSEAIRESR